MIVCYHTQTHTRSPIHMHTVTVTRIATQTAAVHIVYALISSSKSNVEIFLLLQNYDMFFRRFLLSALYCLFHP